MRINNIDRNTNFKMALKINPELKNVITKKGTNFVTYLESYRKNISDIEKYHVVLDENIHTPKIIREGEKKSIDYFSELRREERFLGKRYEVPHGMDGDTVMGFNPDEPSVFRQLYGKEAKAKYAEFKKLDVYEQAAKYSRMLEELDIKKLEAKKQRLQEQSQKQAEQEELAQMVNDMIEKCKYEKPVEPDNNTQNWWQKMFKKLFN